MVSSAMEISTELDVICDAGGVGILLDIFCIEMFFSSVLLSVNSLLCESLILRALILLVFLAFFFVYLSFRIRLAFLGMGIVESKSCL